MNWKEFEDYAICKMPAPGNCPNSPFVSGDHRAGLIPVFSLIDGALPGVVAKTFCLECGKEFKKQTAFIPRSQIDKREAIVNL